MNLRELDRIARWAAIPSAVFLIWKIIERQMWPPVPERFPEAADAFFYFVPSFNLLWPLGAIRLIIYGEACRLYLLWWRNASKRTSIERKAAICPWAAIILTGVAAWTLPLDSAAYDALTDSGYVGRNHRTGAVERAPWSALKSVEFYCWWTRGGRGDPNLNFRFDGIAFAPDVHSMTPYHMRRPFAFVRVQEHLSKTHAPVVWTKSGQRTGFDSGESHIVHCVDELVGHFPPENRNAFYAWLLSARP